ncbi:flavin-containing monooxygenase 5-like isoform X1 [Engraulis encrasicolus]|uniref:flavin-containing monooxygenase 5-like isoform X1 n=1 Tax=Engraulis encrasicolus TaxID=184585 RepID=UPI002FD6021E
MYWMSCFVLSCQSYLSYIMDYFNLYADHFKLRQCIHFQTRVLSVKPRPDFSRSGQWDVETEDRDGSKESQVFDAIMVCVGHHCHPRMPVSDFPGMETFKGKYFHSRDYKTPDEWRGKRAVVIGIGNSGGDIAVELSRVTKQCFLSTRRGAWVLNRVGDNGMPLDMVFTRTTRLLQKVLPFEFFCDLVEKQLNKRFDHAMYGLQPRHRFYSQHPTLNDELPNRILSGTVQVKPNIKEVRGSSVVFDNGAVEHDIDLIVFATGYSFSFPFLPPHVLSVSDNKTSLYKYIYPPGLERPTLAVIGLIQPLGAIMPISEMQSRWATRVFKGLNKLPPMTDMMKDIKCKEEDMAKRYVTSKRHTIQVDYVPYMDELAEQIGVQPRFLSLLLRDPGLWLRTALGPCTPYQFRLFGPGRWEGARQAIYTQYERVVQPLKTRPVPAKETRRRPYSAYLLPLTATAAAALIMAATWGRESSQEYLQYPIMLLERMRAQLPPLPTAS